MREIKLRAWDKADEEIIEVGAIAWVSNVFDTKSYTFGSQPHFYDTKGNLHLNNECEFMQYVGLKDKEGKEIYEGDILEYTFEGRTNIDVIIYKGNMFTYKNSIRWNLQKDKVIGNIYQNSDLLEAE